jgi:2,5-diamino-6-(ribosylamino)-4(3H)-pyrimidinone 5'-phosphate reductase
MNRRGLPFVFLNAAMTADGKIAPASRRFEPFGGPRDRQHLLELRATADAVMAGARTVDLDRVNMGPGPIKYRRARLQRGLAEYNLRVIVSGSGTIDPEAEIFRHRFSPIIILTSGRASRAKLRRLREVADEVKVCGQNEIDFAAALRWLAAKWKVKRLLGEGGGEVNGALFKAGLVDEVHVTVCPLIFGGRGAPTVADGDGVERLAAAARLRLVSMKQFAHGIFLVYRKILPRKSAKNT